METYSSRQSHATHYIVLGTFIKWMMMHEVIAVAAAAAAHAKFKDRIDLLNIHEYTQLYLWFLITTLSFIFFFFH